MPLLQDADRQALRQEFASMTGRVRINFFTDAVGSETSAITAQILDELAPLADKLQVVKHNYELDRTGAARYGITRIPAMAVVRLEPGVSPKGLIEERERDYGIRFYGVPSGYEFMSLIGAILDVSAGDSSLSPASREMLALVTEPIHLQVFTTPT